jgi:amidophosphoribosyltransferase
LFTQSEKKFKIKAKEDYVPLIFFTESQKGRTVMGAVTALSVNPDTIEGGGEQFLQHLFRLTFFQQPHGQKYGGMATLRVQNSSPEDPILVKTHKGLYRPGFEGDQSGFRMPLGLGHISDCEREPYYLKRSAFPPFAICFAGNLQNRDGIIFAFTAKGKGFERDDDVALLCHLIIESGWNKEREVDSNFLEGFAHMTEKAIGAYSLAILTEDRVYAYRGLDAHEPLFLGRKKGTVAVVSDTTGFGVQDFDFDRVLEPGEVVVLKNGIAESKGIIRCQRKISCNFCSFKGVYTSGPCSIITKERDAATVRRFCGAALAKRDIESDPQFIPHVVIPIPESGRFHYLGYERHFAIQHQLGKIPFAPLAAEFLTKFGFAFRSYTLDAQAERDREADIKIVALPIYFIPSELLEFWLEKGFAKREGDEIIIHVVVVDDSIVRGTQSMNNLIPKTMSVDIQTDMPRVNIVARIHFRIANPKLLSACRWGKSTRTDGELIARKDGTVRTDEEIAEILGITSCRFNTITDIAAAHGMPEEQLCFDCSRMSV